MKAKMDPKHSTQLTRKWLLEANTSSLLRKLIGLILSLQTLVVAGQSSVVSGRITDESGEAIPGVNVIVKGTIQGTSTDLDGRYKIIIQPDGHHIIVFSFVGYKTEEVEVASRTTIDLQLHPDVTELNEMVVTGYSAVMKKDIASSISVVDVDDMKKIAASNFADQLQGKVAGVQISSSGNPGAVQYVRVRGIGTINNNEPLYVIDGVPVQNETDMNFLNPNDIETMQVLKDAAAASIYGARAANGVVVITTKRGTGRSKFNFDFFTGIQDPQKFPEMANPSELMEIHKGLYAGAGRPFESTLYVQSPVGSGNWVLPDYMVNSRGYAANDPAIDPSNYVLNTSDPSQYAQNFPIAAANKDGTDWFKEIFKPASMTSAQLSASGGNEKGSHYLSVNYFDYNGILIENKWQRIQTRLNSTFSLGKNFRVGENLNVSFQSGKGRDGLPVRNAYSYLSIGPVFDIMGYWAANSQFGIPGPNPVAAQTRNADGFSSLDLRLTGNVFAEFDFLKNFTFRTSAGLDFYNNPYEFYNYTCPECSLTGTNGLEKGWNNRRTWVITGTLNFNQTFGEHTLYALAGVEVRNSFNESLAARANGLEYGDDPYYRELNNAQSGTATNSSSSSDSRMTSIFINANYTFRDKYILGATLRRDGSSKFINNKYGVFPGVSAAWRISQEPFLYGLQFISDLKLRASYGITGNNEVVGGDYPGYTAYGTTPWFSSYPIDGSPNKFRQGFAQTSSGNPELKWETCALTNIAMDATFGNRLDVTLEWYNRKTKDMIFGVAPPLETGNVFLVNTNIGSMVNNGIDLQVNYKGDAFSKALSYTIGITGTHYTNKVLSLSDSTSFVWGSALHPGFSPISRTQPGYPIAQFYGYDSEGLWQSQTQIETVLFNDSLGVSGAEPGRMKFRDVNGNGVIDDGDRTFIGNPLPKFILGLNVSLSFKNFDLTTSFAGVFGNKVFNAVKSYTDFASTNVLFAEGGNRSRRMLYEAGKTLPVLDLSDTYSGLASDYFVEDGSFFRCRNLVLGYSLPPKMILKAGLTKTRIYFQVQNLFTLTRYSGLDPDVTVLNKFEGNLAGRDLTTGMDLGRYPWSRQFTIGINLEF